MVIDAGYLIQLVIKNGAHMNARSRILTALDGGEPDRIPCALGFYRVDLEKLVPHGENLEDLVDIRFISFPISPEEQELSRKAKPYSGDTRLGTQSQVMTYARWMYQPQNPGGRNPLALAQSIDDLESFPFPDLSNPYHVSGLAEQVAEIHARGLAAGGNLPHLGGELFEAAWRLRGLENFLIDLKKRPEWAHFLLDRLTELAERNAETMARAGVDVLSLDDDVGMPVSMIISPDTWRMYFKPRMDKIICSARAIKPDLRVLYHSDGYYEPILGDLIDIGVNAINPVQPDHMDAVRIRKQYGNRLALWGTVGTQTAFSYKKPHQIRDEVFERINKLGRAGLILCPAYDIDEPDIPWENIKAFLNSVRDLGG